MKSEHTIYMDYQKTMSQAEELYQLAAKIKNIKNKDLAGVWSGVSAAWKGENANKYLQKGKKVEKTILSTSSELERTASSLKTIAKRTYKAEMEALQLARSAN